MPTDTPAHRTVEEIDAQETSSRFLCAEFAADQAAPIIPVQDAEPKGRTGSANLPTGAAAQAAPSAKPGVSDADVAILECADAVRFFDKVKAGTEAEKIAVGTDHWDRLEAACRSVAAHAALAADRATREAQVRQDQREADARVAESEPEYPGLSNEIEAEKRAGDVWQRLGKNWPIEKIVAKALVYACQETKAAIASRIRRGTP